MSKSQSQSDKWPVSTLWAAGGSPQVSANQGGQTETNLLFGERSDKKMERETGLEPATISLEG